MKKKQVFILHFAGGNCYSFRFLNSLLDEFDVITLELPGRGKRLKEALLRDFDLAAQDIFTQILQKRTSSSYLLYGHSMGAYLALRVANMLEKNGKPPAHLIVSGNAGPGIRDTKSDKMRYLLDRELFIDELRRLGGIPAELLENAELFNFFEPILRADFEIAEKNNISQEPPVHMPLLAIMGDREEKVEEIANWANFTRSDFEYQIMEGGHFFIHNHPERIAAIIRHCYERVG